MENSTNKPKFNKFRIITLYAGLYLIFTALFIWDRFVWSLIFGDTGYNKTGVLIGWIMGVIIGFVFLGLLVRLANRGILLKNIGDKAVFSKARIITRVIIFIFILIAHPLSINYFLSITFTGDIDSIFNIFWNLACSFLTNWVVVVLGGLYFLEGYYCQKLYVNI